MTSRLGEYDLQPSKDLQGAFNKLTEKDKLDHDLLVHKLARLNRSYGKTPVEKEAVKAAFDALAHILKDQSNLRPDVVDYIAQRTNLHEPFREHLRKNGNAGLIHYLDQHTMRRALH